MAVMRSEAEVCNGQTLISASGQKHSFKQTDKRSTNASFVTLIASIEDPAMIQKTLAHLGNTAGSAATALLPNCRASPNGPYAGLAGRFAPAYIVCTLVTWRAFPG
jgi:hypothetical protein